MRADVTDELDVERLFAESIAAFGGVDAVVHTTMRSASLLYQHAAGHLHRGAAIVSVSTAEAITPASRSSCASAASRSSGSAGKRCSTGVAI